ncbi:hypothetical protein CW304_22565 [Bacillus sp. UFRGS-B20]|nr:hypothetical protein CW304_22565 [Bacillus sp. UFRGS-B20]
MFNYLSPVTGNSPPNHPNHAFPNTCIFPNLGMWLKFYIFVFISLSHYKKLNKPCRSSALSRLIKNNSFSISIRATPQLLIIDYHSQ